MKSLFKILLLSFILLLQSQAKESEKITLHLDWLHQFQFAGYYMAKEKGFYKNHGLEVDIKEFSFGANQLNNVINKEKVYSVGKSSLIIDKLEGKKIVLLAAIYQQSPMVLISLKKSNINNPSKLKNKRIMITSDAKSAASIYSMIISQGVQLDKVNFQEHTFKLDDLINSKTDAMACYLSNEPFILKKKNIDFTIHNPTDYGFDFLGGILYTSQKELENNPIRVRNMYNATLKGWIYAFNHIEETAKLIFDKYNTQNKTLESLIYEGKELKKLAKFEEGSLGNIDDKKIEEIKRIYLLLSLTKNNTSFKIDDLVYDPNRIIYTEDKKNYLKSNKLTLLSNDSFPPFTMMSQDKLTGVEIDYWKLINKKLKINDSNIKIVNKVKKSIDEIKKNPNYVKYSFSKQDNKDSLITTDTIAEIKIGIATFIDKAYISNLSELGNKKIAISKYSNILPIIEKNYPNVNIQKVSNINEALSLLSQNKVYAAIAKVPALSYHITTNNYTNLKISGTLDEKFEMKLAVNKENKQLLDLLNEAISMIHVQEKNNIHSKYYSIVYQTSVDYSWFYKIIIPLLVIIIFIVVTNRRLNDEIKRRKEIETELHVVANIDSLTNINNRRRMESLFKSEFARIKRYHRDLSIIFFDIDNFKLINDELGHASGDEVLAKLASVVRNNIRLSDHFGRWGGEEFVIILPETNKEKASNVAYILKDKIANTDFNIERQVTCSFGVSQFEETDSSDSLLIRADHAMYYVKRNGKNGVKIA